MVAVGSTACVNPVNIEAFEFGSFGDLSNEFFRCVGQRHRVAVADAFDCLSYAGSPNGSSQFVDAVVEIFVIFVVPVASVELNNAFFGNDVRSAAAFDHTGVDRCAFIDIGQTGSCERKAHSGDVGVGSFVRSVAGVGSLTVEGHDVVGRTLSGANELTACAGCFKNQSAGRFSSDALEPGAGSLGTGFFVRVQSNGDGESFQIFRTSSLQSVVDGKNTALAVAAAGAVGAVAFHGQRTSSGSSVRENGVEVSVEENVIAVSVRLVRSEQTVAGIRT